MSVEPNIYEFVLLNVRPECVVQFYTKTLERNKMFEKYGAKTHGCWMTEAGSIGTFFVLREWASLSTRITAREKMWHDQEWQKMYKECGPMLRNVQSFLCKTPANMPIKHANPRSHVIVHKMKPLKFSVFAAQKYRDMMVEINKMIMPDLMHHMATLYPMVYDQFCMLTIWEVPDDKIDMAYNRMVECRRDPTNWEKLSELQETYVDEMNVLAVPVTANGAPRF